MFVEHNFYVGLRDITFKNELSNTSLLSYLEDVGCMHSEIAGYGVTNIDIIKRTWILLSWKIHVIKRPKFNDILKVRTWSRCIDKFYAFRDFEVFDQNNELLCIATSKWLFIDTEKGKPIKISEEVSDKYKQENKAVFEEVDLPKLIEPEEFISSINYKITRNMIDVNNHLHNIYYMDIVKEALPEEVSFSGELNDFEIMYKKEVKLGETVKAYYSKENDYHYVTIKSEDDKLLHAIIRLK